MDPVDEAEPGVVQLRRRCVQRRRRRTEQILVVGEESLCVVAHDMTESAADAVALDGVSAAAADRVRDPGRAGLRRAAATQHERAPPHAASRCEGTKGAWVTDSPDQAESRVRPFNRRFFSNARPARVCMR